jgi:hypothetical protein
MPYKSRSAPVLEAPARDPGRAAGRPGARDRRADYGAARRSHERAERNLAVG